MSAKIKTAIGLYKSEKKKNGELSKWTDKQVLTTRDKMRKMARSERGNWTLEFYESLQLVNKESLKRKLNQKTA